MGIAIAIGNYIGNKRKSPYWTPQRISDTFLFFGETSKITGGKLYNQVTGATDYMTVTGTGLNAVYETPDNATYRTADEDYCHWKTDLSRSVFDGNRAIAYDFSRTIIKYDNASPYVIRVIAILKSGVTLTATEEDYLRDEFELSYWWSDELSFHGALKSNRASEQSVWTAETVSPNGDCSALTATTYSYNKIDLAWTNGSTNEDGISIERSANGTTGWAEIATVGAGITTYQSTGLVIDTRYFYRVRAFKGSQYSNYTSVASDWTSCVVREIIDSNSDGLANYYEFSSSGYAMTASIVTGNGFTGNAQRVVENNGDNWLYIGPNISYHPSPVKLMEIGTAYSITLKWRSSGIFRVYTSAGGGIQYPGVNTGDAAVVSIPSYTPAAEGGRSIIFETIECAPGCWLEINDFIIKRVIT